MAMLAQALEYEKYDKFDRVQVPKIWYGEIFGLFVLTCLVFHSEFHRHVYWCLDMWFHRQVTIDNEEDGE
ncbi:hypothetical protein L1887_02258 [Cichorium endivia]|nr:hypothetical protein L1887_02258 [Cichorium endivia]